MIRKVCSTTALAFAVQAVGFEDREVAVEFEVSVEVSPIEFGPPISMEGESLSIRGVRGERCCVVDEVSGMQVFVEAAVMQSEGL